MGTTINLQNFMFDTFAKFRKCAEPMREADYVSESGSRYWYENGEVIRQSDHWGHVASCHWIYMGLRVYGYEKSTGVCLLSDFSRRGSEKEHEYITEQYKTRYPLSYKWEQKVTKKELALLEDEQVRAKVRTFSDMRQIYNLVEDSLKLKPRLSMKDLEGCSVCLSACVWSDFPKAYTKKGSPEGTVISMVFKGGRPRMTEVRRDVTSYKVSWTFTDEAKVLILGEMAKS